MRASLRMIYHLGVKELYSLARDPVLVGLILYTFTFAIYTVAHGVKTEVRDASIAFVDEDGSELSRRVRDAFLLPYFKKPEVLTVGEIDAAMDAGRFTFVVDIPPDFQADVLAGRTPTVQLNVDATAMTLAGNGTLYVSSIINQELASFVSRSSGTVALPAVLTVRAKFNPNLESSWFMAVMQIISNVTMLSMIVAGASVIREREHGTIEHLLVMPLVPSEIILAKIWANGLVIVVASVVSLTLVVKGLLGVVLEGSTGLFALGAATFLFAMTALGITLATIAKSMPQFGLLTIPFFVVMNLLSGGVTPLEAMPEFLQVMMQATPSKHFTAFAQSVLFRGAGIEIVWPMLAAMIGIGSLLFLLALMRFRATMSVAR
jgi:ABC-2 type transport system permease protein